MELEVLPGRELDVERGILEDEPEARPNLVGLSGDVEAGEGRRAAARLQQRA